MARAAATRTGILNRAYAGAIAPQASAVGSLLTQYASRLGDTLLRHRAELAERAARIEAEMASRIKTEFIANISHELRTPLNSILGFSKMLKSADGAPLDPAQVSEYAEYILTSAESLLAIVNDVITISKLQSGKYRIEVEEADLDESLRSCVNWAMTQAKENGLQFVPRIDENLPPVFAAPEQLQNVVMRLLGNAIAFTPEGGSVALTVKPVSANKAMVCVSDNGVGMTAQEITVALSEFGQVDNAHDRQNEGTGLGLPISKALTELQGGTFTIRSEKGKGTDVIMLFNGADQSRNSSGQGNSRAE
jgi:two-component system cell cycle sensor histidine kinase PleC